MTFKTNILKHEERVITIRNIIKDKIKYQMYWKCEQIMLCLDSKNNRNTIIYEYYYRKEFMTKQKWNL